MTTILKILQHSLGLDQYGQGRQYRNNFVTGPGGKDFELCRQATEQGFMADLGAKVIAGGSHLFRVTPAGIDHVALTSPAPPPKPKLTRSQERYQAYLSMECCESFGEFLRYGWYKPSSY